jgi:hypothetical protein
MAQKPMPRINNELREGEDELKAQFEVLNYAFEDVKRVKRRPSKKRNFSAYTKEINNAYTNYMKSEAYTYIETIINDTLEKVQDSIYFHEGNACPEFWEQTRIVGGVNLAEDLLRCASSLLDA